MTADAPAILSLAECDDAALCGGKAINLGRMLRAGLPVPEGFVVSTAAFRRSLADSRAVRDALSPELVDEVAAAYRRLGSPAVAVRSSATAEDLPDASMAGQYETLLDVSGEQKLIDAVHRCWQSLSSQRLQSYLREQGIDADSVAMAVVVQRLVPAETAGVLFTANPRTAARDEMLIEAAWGLGEAVVSGIVQPDVVVIDRESGGEKSYTVADKAVCIKPGLRRQSPVDPRQRNIRCLSPQNTQALWQLGRRVVEHFGVEQDIEWAICDGQHVLLQSRPITTLDDAEAYNECLESTRGKLRQRRAEGRGPWAQHNIAETLPHPTPLTWSVIGHFMSGRGGFGTLYRNVGFEPSERVCRDGFLQRIAGRIYSDLSLAPEMYFDGFPFRYDADLLRGRPDLAQQPPALPSGSWLRQAEAARRLGVIEQTMAALAASCDRRLREDVLPAFTHWVEEEKQRDLSILSEEQWYEVWQQRESRVMDQLAPEILLPSMIAAMGIERLRAFLNEHFWSDNPADLLNVLAVSEQADCTIEANEALRAVGLGQSSCDGWTADYGYRGPEEFDLASPRWRERPDEVVRLAAMLARSESPVEIHHRRSAEAHRCAETLRAKLSRRGLREFDERLAVVRQHLPWREDGKAALVLGYDLLRDSALDAGRRLGIGDDVFLLSLDEVRQALDTQSDVEIEGNSNRGRGTDETIRDCRRRRAAERRVSLPLFIGPDEIEKLGQPLQTVAGRSLTAVPISTGSASGPVRIVHDPSEAGELARGYVLVCPSTDPSWTPLFVDAAALVLECGGMLSHGAVVARELGIPAVVLPGATQLLADGEEVSVDGRHGVLVREQAGKQSPHTQESDPADVRIPLDRIPPVTGPRERPALKLSGVFLLVWGIYLTAVFALPRPWCYDPSMKLLDTVLWPLVSALGKPGAVAALAAGLAVATMIGQRMLTDNRRLWAAKQRANRLRREQARLPAGSPRHKALGRASAGVQPRLLGASLVPLAMLLGPMVMSFVWLPERVDPASWNPPPGAVAHVTAIVDGEHTGPVRLDVDSTLVLDEQSPATRSAPPVRSVLQRLLARWVTKSATPETLDADGAHPSPEHARSRIPPEMIADLQEYLSGPLPPQTIAWSIHTPPEPGRYPIAVSAGDAAPIRTSLVLGDRHPPEPKQDMGDGRGPLQTVQPLGDVPIQRVTVNYQYPRTLGDRTFFAPLEHIPIPGVPDSGWSQWDAGWLLTYVGMYLLVLFPMRWLLRIP